MNFVKNFKLVTFKSFLHVFIIKFCFNSNNIQHYFNRNWGKLKSKQDLKDFFPKGGLGQLDIDKELKVENGTTGCSTRVYSKPNQGPPWANLIGPLGSGEPVSLE